MKRHEIYHHGIRGQKWGVRNGPPYPLAKRTARRKSGLDKSAKKGYNKSKTIERGRYAVGSILGKVGDTPVSELGNSTEKIKMLAKPETAEEALRNTNPTRSHNNCFNCVVAATARMCGLDVAAKEGLSSGRGISFDEVCRVFNLDPDDPRDVVRILNPDMNKVTNQIKKRYSNGDVGAIAFALNASYRNSIGIRFDGHTLNWILNDGNVRLFDSQIQKSDDWVNTFMNRNLDSGKELSLAKFANVNTGLNIEHDTDYERLKNFVK